MFGIGPSELVVVLALLFGGGNGMPTLGVPLPLDPGLQSTAPPECLMYYSYQGIARPDSKSANQVEQLLAEPEIVAFVEEILRLIDEGVKHIPTNDEQQRALARHVPVVVKTLIARPSALYLSKVSLPPQMPDASAAWVVYAGDQTAALVAALEALEKLYLAQAPPGLEVVVSKAGSATLRKLPMPPGAPAVVWGAVDQYVFLTVGADEAETVVARLAKKSGPPEWLSKLQTEIGIKRLASLAYLNAPELIELAEPLIAQTNPQLPPEQVKKWIDLIGLRHLRHVSVAAGLDETMAVSKTLFAHDGKPTGLLALGQESPLTAADLKSIPAHADFAVALRFDLTKLFPRLLQLAGEVDPEGGAQVQGVIALVEQQLGFRIQDDLMAALGDTWSLYHASDDGGALLTGLCGTVRVRDRAKIEKVVTSLLRLAEAQVGGKGGAAPLVIRKSNIGGHEITYAQVLAVPSPIAPAWHWADDTLVFALSPQMLRAHLSRPASAESLADVKAVSDRLATGDVTSVGYSNVQYFLRIGYSYVQYLATAGASLLEQSTGVRADLAKFPSYASINRHLRPSISMTRSTKTGVLTESYSTGPQISGWFMPNAIALILPAVQKAREAARDTASMNNARQLALAILTYEGDKGTLPPRAITSPDGKPLLSWRVAILPYLEQKELYDQFHLDEPWDSPHNQPLVARMPQIYTHPRLADGLLPGTTVYQIPRGKGTLYASNKPLTLVDVSRLPRGTSGTALLVESDLANAVEWTKPDDVLLDADDPASSLSVSSRDTVTILMVDGAVQAIDTSDADTLKQALFPRAK